MYKIYPCVKRVKYDFSNTLETKETFSYFFNEKKENVFNSFLKSFSFLEEEMASDPKNSDIVFSIDPSLNEEAYKISIKDKIYIYYKTKSGVFYSLETLREIINQAGEKIYHLDIFDEPSIKVRGLMLDISRNKVLKVEAIYKIIDMMARLKMNHLELYVEGFSFEYKSFEKYLEVDGFISVKEYLEIEKYANSFCIDLVPNQNGFGHMTKWLEKEEFKSLAECEGGIFLWQRNRPASTLNPLDDASIKLVEAMYDDMLPYSNSKYFNMNFDEPFELGKGKSKEAVEKNGLGNVYIDYCLKAYDIVKKYKKIPMIWGDVLIKHSDLLHRLPKDMIFLDWGYDANHPFNKNLKMLKELNINFMAAPGTTSWASFASRTTSWLENITNACDAVKKHGGLGVILTDWGDFGHLQFLPSSYPSICYMGLYSWNMLEGTYLELRNYLNEYVFCDKAKVMADFVLDLGNYYRFENSYVGNGTQTFYNFMWASLSSKEENPVKYYYDRVKGSILSLDKFKLLRRFFSFKMEELSMNKMEVSDASLINDEFLQTIRFIKMTQKVNIALNKEIDLEKRIRYLEEVVASKDMIIEEQSRLWHERNKSGGFLDSISLVKSFFDFANQMLEFLRRGESYEIKN